MNTQIEEIIDELFNKYRGISREEINRIIKSQFKLTQETVACKGDKIINWMYIGKVKPTPFRVKQLKQQVNEFGENISGGI